MERRWERAGAASGLLFVILYLIGVFAAGSPPHNDAATKDVVSYMVDKRGAILFQVGVIALATMAFIWFLGYLRSLLRHAEGGEGPLASVMFGAGIFSFALGWAAHVPAVAVVWRGAGSINADIARMTYDMALIEPTLTALATALVIAAVSAVVWRTAMLPMWVAYFGALVAAVNVAQATTLFGDAGAFWSPSSVVTATVGLVATMLWFAVASVEMLRHEMPVAAARPAVKARTA